MTPSAILAVDPLNGRALRFLNQTKPCALQPEIDITSPHFYCFIAWDSRSASVGEIEQLVTPLIKAGAAYFCCWGPGCERVHDFIDDIDSYPCKEEGLGSPPDSVIMTTWHSSETIQQALHFFLNDTLVDAHFESTASDAIAISIGSDEWAAIIRAALQDPRGFSESVEY